MDRKIPEINDIYQDYQGEVYKILAIADLLEIKTLIVVYKSLDDQRCEAQTLENFLAILGDGKEGTYYHAFSYITYFSVIWQRLEDARAKRYPHTLDTAFIKLTDIEEIDGRNILEIGYSACTKIVQLLKSFAIARKVYFDMNPNKYVPKEKLTTVEEWAELEKNVFTGLLAIKVISDPPIY